LRNLIAAAANMTSRRVERHEPTIQHDVHAVGLCIMMLMLIS
jgi:hypothetical protein